MKRSMNVSILVLTIVLCVATSALAQQKFPTKPVEATVAWAAGGGADLVFRAMAAVFPKYANGQPLIIKNVPGAAGVPGIAEFMRAKPDGYSILHWNTAHVVKTHMSKVPFTATTFTPIIRLVSAYNYLNVKADAPWKTLGEFLAEAKKNPGNVSVGNAGPGGGNHMAALLLEEGAKVKFLHVPFQGGGPSVIGLMSGQVQSAMNIAPEGISNVQAGQLRILAVFGEKRLANFPNVPTGIEQGVPLTLDQWRGAVAPPNTPADIVAALHDILKKVIEDPEFVSKMKELSTDVAYADGRAFGEVIKADDKRYEQLCQEQKLGERYAK
jgi:tripartite-type tricarboxylate transporter receptor subunit TctC